MKPHIDNKEALKESPEKRYEEPISQHTLKGIEKEIWWSGSSKRRTASPPLGSSSLPYRLPGGDEVD